MLLRACAYHFTLQIGRQLGCHIAEQKRASCARQAASRESDGYAEVHKCKHLWRPLRCNAPCDALLLWGIVVAGAPHDVALWAACEEASQIARPSAGGRATGQADSPLWSLVRCCH